MKKVLVIGGIVVALVGGLAFINKEQAESLGDLPNYTEVKGDFTVTGLDLEKQPFLGNPNAEIEIIEFGDYKCPACRNWNISVYEQIKRELIDTGKAKFYFINYAFLDRDSYLAASAGEAILAQNPESFWQFHEELYKNQGDERKIWATEKFLLNFVKDRVTGIDYDKFAQDLKSHKYLYDVKKDFKIGAYYGVNGTPSIWVNGQPVKDSSFEGIVGAIE